MWYHFKIKNNMRHTFNTGKVYTLFVSIDGRNSIKAKGFVLIKIMKGLKKWIKKYPANMGADKYVKPDHEFVSVEIRENKFDLIWTTFDRYYCVKDSNAIKKYMSDCGEKYDPQYVYDYINLLPDGENKNE